MRYIPRNRKDSGGRIIKPSQAWFKRSKKKTEVALRERGSHEADKNVYGDHNVRAALEKLFDGKCAYCEQKLGDLWHVEHFRPKSSVRGRLDHPGYYWLTYKWSNLYPSCEGCNMKLFDKPLYDEQITGEAAGKADQFPLENEITRAIKPRDSLRREKRLLIDPCLEKPTNFLYFRSDGTIDAVDNKKKGQTSIKVFHLYRKRLNNSRKKVIEHALEFVKAIYSTPGLRHKNKIRKLAKQLLQEDECVHLTVALVVFDRPEEFGFDEDYDDRE